MLGLKRPTLQVGLPWRKLELVFQLVVLMTVIVLGFLGFVERMTLGDRSWDSIGPGVYALMTGTIAFGLAMILYFRHQDAKGAV